MPAGIASLIEKRRASQGLSFNRLAASAGIPVGTLHRRLRNPRSEFKFNELARVAEALGTTVSEMLADLEDGAA